MAVVDEASVRITPDTSGFAEELRADVEAAIDEATAGLDKTVTIKVDVDNADAAAKMRAAIDDFTNDGRTGFAQMKADEQALFDDIGANAEKSRIKQTTEQTKLRDKLKAVWQPAIDKLKKDENDEKTRLDKITKSTTNVAKGIGAMGTAAEAVTAPFTKISEATDRAATSAGKLVTSTKAVTDAEAGRSKALNDVQAAEAKVEAAEQRLIAARAKEQTTAAALQRAEAAVSDARGAAADAADRVATAEDKVNTVRAKEGATTQEIGKAERDLAAARNFESIAAAAAEREENNVVAARGRAAAASATAIDSEQRVTKARQDVQKASADAEKAERDVATARTTGAAATKAFATVEEALGTARTKTSTATKEFKSAEDALKASDKALQEAHNAHIATLGKLGTAFNNLGGKITKAGKGLTDFGKGAKDANVIMSLVKTGVGAAGSAIQGLGSFMSAAATTTEGFSGVMKALGGSVMDTVGSLGEGEKGLLNFGQQLVQLGGQAMTFISIGALVSTVIGAIVAAVAGMPAALSAAGAGFAVIELGMKGIKAAYDSALKPALDNLKKQVSEVFENGLKPEFQDLAQKLIPAVTAPLQQLAGAFVEVTGRVVSFLTSAQGIQTIQGIIDKTTDAVRNLGQPLADLVQKFLALANTGNILQNMIGIVQDLATNVGNWLDQMAKTGDADRAVQALRDTLNTVEQTVLNVATSFMNFFTTVSPGFQNLVQGIGQVVSALLDRLGPAFNEIFQAIGDGLKQISPQVWDQLRDAVQNVADKIKSMADDGTLKTFFETALRLISMAIDAFGRFLGAIDTVVSGLKKFNSAMSGVNQAAEAVLKPLGLWPSTLDDGSGAADKATDSTNNLADAAKNAAPPVGALGPAAAGAAPPVQNLGSTASDMADQVRGAGQKAGGAFDPIAAGAQAAGAAIPPAVNPPVNAIPGTVQNATGQVSFQPVLDAANQVFGQLPQSVANGINGAEQAMTAGTNAMKQTAQDGANAVQQSFAGMATAAGNSMAQLAAAVAGAQAGIAASFAAVATSAQTMATGVQASFTAMGTAATTSFTNMANTVKAQMTAMQTTVTTALTAIKTAFTTGFTGITTATTAFWTQEVTLERTNLTTMQTTLTQFFTTVTQLRTQFIQQTIQTVTQMWQQLVQIVQQYSQQITQQCQQLATQILQIFQNLANDLYNAGVTMMQRLAAGITAGGAQAVAAAQNVAAQIKAQFPASPAKEGPLSGRGDPMISGGKIIERLADGMRRAQSYLNRVLVPIMNSTAHILQRPELAAATTGISITETTATTSTQGDPAPVRLLDTPSSTPYDFRGRTVVSGDGGGGGGGVTPQDIAQALHGLVLRFEDDGRNGMAKVVNRQNRSLARR